MSLTLQDAKGVKTVKPGAGEPNLNPLFSSKKYQFKGAGGPKTKGNGPGNQGGVGEGKKGKKKGKK